MFIIKIVKPKFVLLKNPYLLLLICLMLATGILLIIFWILSARNIKRPTSRNNERRPLIHQGVSSGHPLTTQAGMEILERGGNAVDAAVAIAYASGVVEPYACGLGGGGEMVIYWKQSQTVRVVDFRETAPSNYNKKNNYAKIGIPGFVKGMEYLLEKYGTLPRPVIMDRAIKYAKNGIPTSQTLARLLVQYNGYRISAQNNPAFYKGSKLLQAGALLYQEELALQLSMIAQGGANAFYTPVLAQNIKDTMKTSLYPFTTDDFSRYEVHDTPAVKNNFCGYEIYSTPPPGGGMTLIEILKLAEISKASQPSLADDTRIPLLLQAIAIAYTDRKNYLGDPFFGAKQPDWINQEEYLRKRWNGFGDVFNFADNDEEQSTTHFVVADVMGNWVSCTLTLGNFLGSGQMVDGFFLNNSLDKFSAFANSPNASAPGKRPFSYMAPTLIFKSGRPFLALGTPGGRRIPVIMTQMLLHHLRDGAGLEDAVRMRRYYLNPDRVIFFEKAPPPYISSNLTARGFQIDTSMGPLFYGAIQALEIDEKTGRLVGAADPRREGSFVCKNLRPDKE